MRIKGISSSAFARMDRYRSTSKAKKMRPNNTNFRKGHSISSKVNLDVKEDITKVIEHFKKNIHKGKS